ncbi:conserved hypothetical protein [Nitrosococcus oceani ATCC 19707]|uniref:ATPase AAA-type core domain-containing protein n=2 Tax=Nitrosococcus oceani TaxID=1229 RepID=Q3J6Z0_NITOC|nr:MoxR family ATPase [Nitrosococcus oceani]ABA59406.1 conserved hypothetical protein [Nitrosococcus oceani ATCC 19707]KFI18148.1 ATPase [Nitrosococcus oceani C-27]GEM20022.1 ATPase [Nitrosococcus oceani]
MRPSQITTLLKREFTAVRNGQHTPVMLWGPPGVGKSQILFQVADSFGVPLIDLRLSQLEPTDLRGIPFRIDHWVEWAIPSMLPNSKRHGSEGILFLDELTSAPPTVSAAAYQLILDRQLGEYTVPEGWAIVAAGNRQGDRGITYTLPAPLANRFTHYEIEPHIGDWVTWAAHRSIDQRLIGFLLYRPELLFDFDPNQNPLAFPTPRSWEYAHRALQKFEDIPELLLETLQACVGPGAGLELKAFIDNMAQMPDVEAILRGKDVSIPEALDLQYGVAATLVRRAVDARNSHEAHQIYGHILGYATRLPEREIGVMLVTEMFRAIGRPLLKHPEFAKWARQVSDLMLYER